MERIVKTCKKCGKPISVKRTDAWKKPWVSISLCKECYGKTSGLIPDMVAPY